jgi:hypothetical protein
MLTDPPRSLRQRERQLREAGFTKSEARELLREPPPKYVDVAAFRVKICYPERTPRAPTGGAGAEREGTN